jgi:hypothetical protein
MRTHYNLLVCNRPPDINSRRVMNIWGAPLDIGNLSPVLMRVKALGAGLLSTDFKRACLYTLISTAFILAELYLLMGVVGL